MDVWLRQYNYSGECIKNSYKYTNYYLVYIPYIIMWKVAITMSNEDRSPYE